MRNALIVTIACVLSTSACRSAGNVPPVTAVNARAASALPLDQLVPEHALTYRRTERETLEGTAGIRFRFEDTSSTWLSVFLYSDPEGAKRFPDRAALVQNEGDKFRQVMDIQSSRGLYTNLRMLVSRPDTLQTPRGPIVGHMSAANGVFRGRPVYEIQYLYLVDTTFVKVRATVPEASWPRNDLHGVIAAIVAPLRR